MKCPNCGKSLWFVKKYCVFCKTPFTEEGRRIVEVLEKQEIAKLERKNKLAEEAAKLAAAPIIPAAPTPVAPEAAIKDSGVALLLKAVAILEIVASAIAGFSEGVIGGSGAAQRGWLIFAAGAIGGLVLAGFGCVIDHSYECAQRLRRIEDLLREAVAAEKDK
jgi:hypothetical protein